MPMSQDILAQLELYNIEGKLVKSEAFNSSFEPALIEIFDLPSGVYTWLIVLNQVDYSGKLIVK